MFVNRINSLSNINNRLSFTAANPSKTATRVIEKAVKAVETKVEEKPKSWWERLFGESSGSYDDDSPSYISWDQTQYSGML